MLHNLLHYITSHNVDITGNYSILTFNIWTYNSLKILEVLIEILHRAKLISIFMDYIVR